MIEQFSLVLIAEALIRQNWRVTLRVNIRLKGYLLPSSIQRYIGEWLYYNFAAVSFHRKKLCSRVYSIELNSQK